MSTHTKRTVKFLAICTETEIIRSIIKHSTSNSLLKSICNAALNCASGEISISDSEKLSIQKHRRAFEFLTKKQAITNIKKYLLANKLNVLRLIPVLLDCVLRTIGSSFIIDQKFDKVPESLQPKVIQQIRQRKGLSEGQ